MMKKVLFALAVLCTGFWSCNTLDLNDAQNSKDEARQKHISELYYYWYYYYQIRSLTLWDFRPRRNSNTGFGLSGDGGRRKNIILCQR